MAAVTISRQQARELDRRAAVEFGVPSVVLMENAGRGVADCLCALGIAGPVLVCCGHGNNGGDGFVIARHLDLRGHQARVLLVGERGKLTADAAVNFGILEKSGVPILAYEPDTLMRELAGADWVVDALLGTGAQGEPRSPLAEVIAGINASSRQVLAVDVPSGLDCDSGLPAHSTIRATHTCTFVATKPGFLSDTARPYLGQVHVADIGAPRRLVAEILTRRPPG